MSSEAITRNDLTAILNEVLPPTPSEYKKLLWTNPSPTSQFAEQTISLDLSNYDAVEVIYKLYTTQQYDVTGQITYQSNQSVTVSASGTAGFFNGADAPMARTASMTSSGVHFSAGSLALGTGNWAVNNNALIPYKIYGIKYERVAPPVLEIVDEPFSLTVNVSATNEAEHCFYNNLTNTVRITASIWSASSYWSQTQAFWTIPEKYRPKTAIKAPAIVMTNQPMTAPFYVDIGTDGTIKQALTGACRCIYFSAEYTI